MTDQSTTERVIYAKNDTIETLSAKQLELITKTQCDVLLTIIEDTTYFDVHRLRLMLELGAIEAGRRLDAMTAGNTERIAELERKNAELVKALREIKDMTDADDPESYRCDDREGCLDAVYATASTALASHKKEDKAS